MIVFAITHNDDGSLHVALNAATEMSFDMRLGPEHDYQDSIAGLCRVAPFLLLLDVAYMEHEQPSMAFTANHIVSRFVASFGDRLFNVNVGLPHFSRFH